MNPLVQQINQAADEARALIRKAWGVQDLEAAAVAVSRLQLLANTAALQLASQRKPAAPAPAAPPPPGAQPGIYA